MRRNILIYFLLSISIGFLFYSFVLSDVRYGMMGHHYGYYDDYSPLNYYINSAMIYISITILIIGFIMLLSKKTSRNSTAISILDSRLSSGEITIEEYKRIKSEIQK